MVKGGDLQEEGGVLVFAGDYGFLSVSAAAGVVCGASVNGRNSWKHADGQSYGDWESSQVAAAQVASTATEGPEQDRGEHVGCRAIEADRRLSVPGPSNRVSRLTHTVATSRVSSVAEWRKNVTISCSSITTMIHWSALKSARRPLTRAAATSRWRGCQSEAPRRRAAETFPDSPCGGAALWRGSRCWHRCRWRPRIDRSALRHDRHRRRTRPAVNVAMVERHRPPATAGRETNELCVPISSRTVSFL